MLLITEDFSFSSGYLNTDSQDDKLYYRSIMTIYLMQKKVPNRNIRSIYVFINDTPFVFTIDAGKKELSVSYMKANIFQKGELT